MAELPREYVEMIMKAKSPAPAEQTGRGEALPATGEGEAHGMSVMSKVRSSSVGEIDWARSLYFQVAG